MKNNTLDRPTISKERIAALEELLSDRTPQAYDTTPGVYIRSDKDRELDILWQGFKINGKEERSPGVYLTIGFITGAICMFLMTTILNLGNPSKDSFADLNLWKKGNTEIKEKVTTPVTITPPNQTAQSGRTETYKIQSGDTLESVALKYYGTSDPGKIEQIQTANNMDDPNKLQIGQNIVVPLEN
jgi:LysM repeat protein